MSKISSNRTVVISIAAWLVMIVVLVACNTDSSHPTQASPSPTALPTQTPDPTQVAPSPTAVPTQPPVVDGATVLNTRCLSCHGLTRIANARRTRAQWEQFVSNHQGVQLTAAERTALVDYLAQTYGL